MTLKEFLNEFQNKFITALEEYVDEEGNVPKTRVLGSFIEAKGVMLLDLLPDSIFLT